MSHPTQFLPFVLLALATACSDSNDTSDTTQAMCEPAANAGPDQVVALGTTVTLTGSHACEEGTFNYVWSFQSVPVISDMTDTFFLRNNTDTPETEFEPDVEGTYVISLVVHDVHSGYLSSPDIVIVEVTSDNMPPIADCGEDQSVEVGDRAALDGNGSYDPEGVRLTYQWALTTVPDGSSLDTSDLYNAGGPEATVIPDVAGLYLVSLVVSDGAYWSEPDYCTVEAVSTNQPPVADAGTGGNLPPCTDDEIVLNGYGSYDPEGAQITYLWSLLSAPAGSKASDANFDDATSPTAHFTWDISGTYGFQLLVHDGESWSPPDVVTYTILDRSLNNPPVANAGDDVTISDSADCVTSAYAWTCADCVSATVELDGGASTDPDGDEVHYVWSEDSGELSFATPYRVFTMVTTPPVPTAVNTTITTQWEVTLNLSDCEAADEDEVIVSYACYGNRDYGPY
ncbi:MAG: hypothetical protein JXB39_01530 [Deltaproteobacteria bacterium]|nr:hypothetical protein [Deltaproteobacteria bacterium]